MDLATVVGLSGAAVLVVGSILIAPGATLRGFFDLPSVIMVIGGAIVTVMVAVPFRRVLNLMPVLLKTVFVKSPDLRGLVSTMVEFAVIARRDGILALENHLDENTDSFVAMGIRLAVDGTDPELIEKLLMAEIESLAERHKKGKQVCDLFGKYAPAYGMIGTLVGLVIMLSNMSDPSAIGPGMAVALLTTLYGALLANAFFLPLGDKLAYYSREELQARMLVVSGVLAIQSGDNPRIVEQKLNVFLAPKERVAAS
jgi:chemotaxis protein MotA